MNKKSYSCNKYNTNYLCYYAVEIFMKLSSLIVILLVIYYLSPNNYEICNEIPTNTILNKKNILIEPKKKFYFK